MSSDRMREIDRRCIEDLGIPGVVLMNNAGAAVFHAIEHGPVGVVCGKGNNGGDGFVVARLAITAGMDVRLVLLAEPHEIRGDAATFMNAFERCGGQIESVTDTARVRSAIISLSGCAVLVDAMLGTGATGRPREPVLTAIEAWPRVFTEAVDIPSGLDADTGKVEACAIRADVTVTMQFAKTGFDAPSAKPYLGRVIVADIGIPAVCADEEAWANLGRRHKRD